MRCPAKPIHSSKTATGRVAVLNFRARRRALALSMLMLVLTAAGCDRMALTQSAPPQAGAITLTPQQQQALAQQTQQYQQRAASLDRVNQELQNLLAQARQQSQLMDEQVKATQSQLRDVTNQLASMQNENTDMRTRTTAMAASITRQNTAEIRANNSLLRNLSISNLPGVQVRQDGDVIRVELPG